MKHFVDQDLAKMVPEIYEEEFEAVVDFVAAAIIECICIGFEDFNVDVVRGIIYCAVSQVSSGVFPPPDKVTKYASTFVDIYNKGRSDFR